jgi:hypothetical protein
MILKITLTIILSALAGLLYRLGGASGYNTKFRDLGVPTVGIGLLWFLGGWNWWLILCFGLYFGSLTTYWKKKGTDAMWWNWLFTGLGYSLAFLPYTIATGHYLGFIIRTILVTVLIAVWSYNIDEVVLEENGRGVITTITIPLLLI